MRIKRVSLEILRKSLDSNNYSLVQKLLEKNIKFSYKSAFYYFINTLLKNPDLLNKIRKIGKNNVNFFLVSKLFLLNEKITIEEANLLFPENELLILINDKILIRNNNFILSNYGILPCKGKYFLTDNFKGKKDRYYVYTGWDSILLLNNIEKDISPKSKFNILDVGTGPGTIAISLADKAKKVTACDINQRAIDFAKMNMILNKVSTKKIKLKNCDYKRLLNKYKFDLVISNPPYLPTPHRMKRSFPIYAYGGESGLEFVSELIENFYQSKSRRLFLITLSSGNKHIKILELLKKYNLKIKIDIVKELSIYLYLHQMESQIIKTMLKIFKGNDIYNLYYCIIKIERGKKQINVNTIYKFPAIIRPLEKTYFKLKTLLKLHL